MRDAYNLILIGPMGAGKTRVGQALARKLHLPFYDTDQALEERTGVDIPFIFDKEGELGFRKREKEIVKELTQKKGIVLSTGGGTLLEAANRQYLQASGVIIYLTVSIESQLARTAHNKKRPLLWVENQDRLIQLNAVRTPLYEQMAELTYNTDESNVQGLVRQIVADIEKIRIGRLPS